MKVVAVGEDEQRGGEPARLIWAQVAEHVGTSAPGIDRRCVGADRPEVGEADGDQRQRRVVGEALAAAAVLGDRLGALLAGSLATAATAAASSSA